MSLKLIGAHVSPFVRKVRVFLAEKSLPYEHDPMVPFGVSDEYKRMHPQGKVPVLTDGDKVIPDSSAICVYLEKTQADPSLYPSDAYDLAPRSCSSRSAFSVPCSSSATETKRRSRRPSTRRSRRYSTTWSENSATMIGWSVTSSRSPTSRRASSS